MSIYSFVRPKLFSLMQYILLLGVIRIYKFSSYVWIL
jgi:hypothetical protein